MKRITLVCISVLMGSISLLAETPNGPTKNAPAKNAPAVKFTYSVYGEIPTVKATFEEEHFLGASLNAKWNTFIQTYTRVYDVSVGFSGSTVEVAKPAVYNAVQKVNKYYKKAVRKGTVPSEEALQKLNHILDCANVICMENDTEAFETAIANAKTIEETIALFDHVKLEFI